MNIYAFVPLVATVAYIPLLLTTIGARPWRRQHKLFLLLLIATSSWSLTDYIFRSNFFPGSGDTLIRVIICLFTWVAIQFHFFSSSFFPSEKSRWLPVAYLSLFLNVGLAAFKIIPARLVREGDMLLPDYGWAVFIVAIPLIILVARNVYIFWPRIINQENPIVNNQAVSLLLCVGVLTIFIVLSILPFAKAFPIAHVGNIVVALILSYAVVGHRLVDIRYVLRSGFFWLVIFIIGITIFWTIILALNEIIHFELSLLILFYASIAGILTVLALYKVRDLVARLLGKALQGVSFDYRQRLREFANQIHYVFSLREQGDELLKLTVNAIGCRKAGLLFLDQNGDYELQLIKIEDKNDKLSKLKLRNDNPLIDYLARERRPLTKETMSISPEFLGLWQQEKDAIETAGIELFMPLISRERLIGVLVLDKKKIGHYNLEDYTLLGEITSRVAVSMEKEYLREQLKAREEELSVINRSNTIISSSLDIQRIYDNFIKELKSVVCVDWAAIEVIEGTEIYFMAISTEIGSPWKVGERIPLKGTATEWVASHHKSLIERDLAMENPFASGEYLLKNSLRCIAFLPLIISNQVIGALTVASRVPDAYNSRHIKLLEQLSSQISMPIENARLYAKTEQMARVDSLTGLLNRRSLDEMLPSEIGRHSRYGGVFTLIILDMDNFKALNDNFGHLAGDELLRQIGTIMRTAIRETDRAFRFGGDEFAIVLPQTTIDAALKVAERIRQQTYARIEIGAKPISLSLGLATWPTDGVVSNDLIAAADAALYQAKRAGGNRSHCSVIEFSSGSKTPQTKTIETQGSSALSAIFALAATVDSRDKYSHNHSKKVHDFSIAIGQGLGMKPLELNLLGTCALLHDIGKIGISDEILNKQETLSDVDWEVIRSHARLGAAIVSHSTQLSPHVAGILHHHERYDGAGYPDALKGDDIPLESRILAIADSFASMTSARVYSKELTYESAIEELKRCAGEQFDPKLVNIFIEVLKQKNSDLDQCTIVNKKN